MRLADVPWFYDDVFEENAAKIRSVEGSFGLLDYRPIGKGFIVYPITAQAPLLTFTSELELSCWLADKSPLDTIT